VTRGGVVLTVNGDGVMVERQLACGELDCPGCGGGLGGWGRAPSRRSGTGFPMCGRRWCRGPGPWRTACPDCRRRMGGGWVRCRVVRDQPGRRGRGDLDESLSCGHVRGHHDPPAGSDRRGRPDPARRPGPRVRVRDHRQPSVDRRARGTGRAGSLSLRNRGRTRSRRPRLARPGGSRVGAAGEYPGGRSRSGPG